MLKTDFDIIMKSNEMLEYSVSVLSNMQPDNLNSRHLLRRHLGILSDVAKTNRKAIKRTVQNSFNANQKENNKTELNEAFSNLCSYDKRNPDYSDLFEPDEIPEKKEPCYCDNCFYGRHNLALQIIELMQKNNK